MVAQRSSTMIQGPHTSDDNFLNLKMMLQKRARLIVDAQVSLSRYLRRCGCSFFNAEVSIRIDRDGDTISTD
jgi:hypothetical protein